MNIYLKSALLRIAANFSCFLKKNPIMVWRIRYWKDYNKRLNLKNPQSFMEKIIWISLFYDTSKWTDLADKYAVREYVKNKCGEQYLNKIYGVYNTTSDINYDVLPNSFVLKTTNGCATNILVRDKICMNQEMINLKLSKWLKFPYGELTGQLHYTRIKPRIIAEEYLKEGSKPSLTDYKFFCFNGVPKYVVVYADREENTHNYSVMVYDMDWNAYPKFVNPRCATSDIILPPIALEEMVSIVSCLSESFPFVRVDLYIINDRPIFGEMTFTPDVVSNITTELTDLMSKWIDI